MENSFSFLDLLGFYRIPAEVIRIHNIGNALAYSVLNVGIEPALLDGAAEGFTVHYRFFKNRLLLLLLPPELGGME